MDFVILSYLQSITLLNVRPQQGPYKFMSQSEWLKQLLLPQPGQKFSLIEMLSLSLKPRVLGRSGFNHRGLVEPLIYADGRLKFSSSLLKMIKESTQIRQSQIPEQFETGLGCPAGYCDSGQEQTSMRLFSLLLVKVFSQFDRMKIPGTGLYDGTKEYIYRSGAVQLEQISNKRF